MKIEEGSKEGDTKRLFSLAVLRSSYIVCSSYIFWPPSHSYIKQSPASSSSFFLFILVFSSLPSVRLVYSCLSLSSLSLFHPHVFFFLLSSTPCYLHLNNPNHVVLVFLLCFLLCPLFSSTLLTLFFLSQMP